MSCLFYVGMFRLANHSSYSKAPDGRPLADLGGREGGAKMRARGGEKKVQKRNTQNSL